MSSSVAGVSVDYGSWSQYDIVLNQHLDMGSSCCTLFASTVAVGVLVERAALGLEPIERSLAQLCGRIRWHASA